MLNNEKMFLDLCKFNMMDILWNILIIVLHVYVIIDAIGNRNKRQGTFRLILAFIPPVIGPIIYLMTKPRGNRLNRRDSFMQGKRRFS